jgi:cytochrome oxidase Cu insertion factor (SCO1/SenC/PrrC family)
MKGLFFLIPVLLFFACNNAEQSEVEEDGLKVFPNEITAFTLVNQDSTIITKSTFADKIFVTDFFFTSCPSICPIMAHVSL